MWSLHHYPFSTKQANEWPFIALPIKLYLSHSFGYYLCWSFSNVISSLYIYFLSPKAIHLPASWKLYLWFGNLNLVSKRGYYFFFQNIISFAIPFSVNTIIHPVLQVILYSFQNLPHHQTPVMTKYCRFYQFIIFLGYCLSCLSTAST